MTVTDAAYLPAVRRPAALGRRVGAYLIDSAIALLVLLIAVGIFAGVAFATDGAFPLPAAAVAGYVVLAGWLVVYTLMQGGAGSLGMRALGLRLAHEGDDSPLGFGRALGRNVVWALGGWIIVGMFSPLFDSSPWHRGWHDKASGAVMTDVAGHSPALAEDGSPTTEPADAASPVPAAPAILAAAVPQVLPEAPILPVADPDGPGGWTPAATPPRAAAPAGGLISFVPGVSDPATFDAPPPAEPAAIPVIDVAPTAQPVLEDPLEQTRLSTGERPVARLVWDDGTRQALYGRTVFGRNPAPETGAMVSPVRDETLSLSKTHFELDCDDERALWVIDRHSTNGVVVRRGTQRHRVEPGERTRVRMGDVLEFGDRHVIVEVAS